MRVLIVIPTYNERDNLPRLVSAVLGEAAFLDVLVVDDGSPDGTGEMADSLASKTNRVRVIHRRGKLGLGTAYVAGFEYALGHNYDCAVQMDADFSHRPQDLKRLLQAIASADLVIGSRNVPGGQVQNWSFLRQFVSKGGSFYARTILNLPIRDCTSGFKCFRREVLKAIDFTKVESNGYGFQVEMNYLCHRAGFQIVEVPIVFPDRSAGCSKMSWRIFLEAVFLVWRLRTTQRPSHSKGTSASGEHSRQGTDAESILDSKLEVTRRAPGR